MCTLTILKSDMNICETSGYSVVYQWHGFTAMSGYSVHLIQDPCEAKESHWDSGGGAGS